MRYRTFESCQGHNNKIMRTRSEQLYNIYRPGSQRSQRDREHFDNAWNLQQSIPNLLTGSDFDYIDTIWLNYNRTSAGGFSVCYTVFLNDGSYRLYFQNLTRLTDTDQVISFLTKNLTTQKNEHN